LAGEGGEEGGEAEGTGGERGGDVKGPRKWSAQGPHWLSASLTVDILMILVFLVILMLYFSDVSCSTSIITCNPLTICDI